MSELKKILIFGGTSEGKELALKLSAKYKICLCVATPCGKNVLDFENDNIEISVGRLSLDDMKKFIDNFNCDVVIDATHPYAVIVTENIKACSGNKKYIRLIREQSEYDYGTVVDSIKEACEIAKSGNILATTGSKQVAQYKHLNQFYDGFYARVLPTEESVKLCKDAGLKDFQILTKLGVSTYEENISILKKYNIKTLITKDGGKKGGFDEKYTACKFLGIDLIIIKRPVEQFGYTLAEVLETEF